MSLAPTNPLGPGGLWPNLLLIRKKGLCPSNGGINWLMIMMMILCHSPYTKSWLHRTQFVVSGITTISLSFRVLFVDTLSDNQFIDTNQPNKATLDSWTDL
jgi:hypothetical protein